MLTGSDPIYFRIPKLVLCPRNSARNSPRNYCADPTYWDGWLGNNKKGAKSCIFAAFVSKKSMVT